MMIEDSDMEPPVPAPTVAISLPWPLIASLILWPLVALGGYALWMDRYRLAPLRAELALRPVIAVIDEAGALRGAFRAGVDLDRAVSVERARGTALAARGALVLKESAVYAQPQVPAVTASPQ